MLESHDLRDRVAVVTGATRGIGAAIAEALAANGAHLILNSFRDPEALESICAQLREKYGVQAFGLIGDVANSETAASLAKLAFSNFKRADIWVNNAGVLAEGLLGVSSPAEIERAVSVNLNSVLYGTQAALRLMRRANKGSIINLSSIMGRFGAPGLAAYSASKAGIIGATLAAAKEVAPYGIRVNAVAPGFIESDMTSGIDSAKYSERIASIGMQRAGLPSEVADTVLFLSSDRSKYVTGQTIGVDGGMVI